MSIEVRICAIAQSAEFLTYCITYPPDAELFIFFNTEEVGHNF